MRQGGTACPLANEAASLKLCPSDPDKRSDILPELDEIDLAERFALRQPVVPDPSEPRTDAVDGRSHPQLRENPHRIGLQRDAGADYAQRSLFSITSGLKPRRRKAMAAVTPAIPPPAMRMRLKPGHFLVQLLP